MKKKTCGYFFSGFTRMRNHESQLPSSDLQEALTLGNLGPMCLGRIIRRLNVPGSYLSVTDIWHPSLKTKTSSFLKVGTPLPGYCQEHIPQDLSGPVICLSLFQLPECNRKVRKSWQTSGSAWAFSAGALCGTCAPGSCIRARMHTRTHTQQAS